MMVDDKYTIYPFPTLTGIGLRVGPIYSFAYMNDGRLIEEIVVGPYCEWPKREPRLFEVTWGKGENNRRF